MLVWQRFIKGSCHDGFEGLFGLSCLDKRVEMAQFATTVASCPREFIEEIQKAISLLDRLGGGRHDLQMLGGAVGPLMVETADAG